MKSDLPSFAQTFAWLKSLSPEFTARVNHWLTEFEAVKADGKVSFIEIKKLAMDAQADLMKLLAFFEDIKGPAKKEAVLVIVGKLFDSIPVFPVPWWLLWLEPWLRARARVELLEITSYAIDSIYDSFLKKPQLSVFPPAA